MRGKILRAERSGFTLVELLVVIAIIGVLASTVLAAVQDARSLSRDAKRLQEVKQLQTSLEIYRNANGGQYPCATTTCANVVVGATTYFPAGALTLNYASLPTAGTPPADFLTTVNYTPSRDPVLNGSIQYRLRSSNLSANHGSSPDRSSYTVLVRLERDRINTAGQTIVAGDWCSISSGPGHVWWNDVIDTSPANAGEVTYPSCF
jgi:prepilin-type N-terminal cleavage/methylation domain-containing protein